MIEWTREDHDKAVLTGWCVSEVHGRATIPDGAHCIEKWDDSDIFDNDADALRYVMTMALNGDSTARKALYFVLQESE